MGIKEVINKKSKWYTKRNAEDLHAESIISKDDLITDHLTFGILNGGI